MSDIFVITALTGRPFSTIPEVWEARVRATPDAIFLIYQGMKWSYREASESISLISSGLTRRGLVQSGDRVASFLGNSPETLWTWLGALNAGTRYCPLNRAHRGPILREMISRTRARVLVTDRSGWDELSEQAITPPMTVLLITGTELELIATGTEAVSESVPPREKNPFSEALVIYTSGSTGRSKAVRLAHVALTHGAGRVVEAWKMSAADVFHAWLPHFHIAGLLHQTMATIVAGGSIALFATFSASRFWQQIRDTQATIVIGLPNVVNIVMNAPPHPAGDRSSLRLWLTTTINPAIQSVFEKRFGVKLLDQYGMTEAELLTLPTLTEVVPAGSCGRPGPDWEIGVVGPDDRAVPAGAVGEIVARPKIPGILMLGYDADDAATVDSLRNAWFHCGDSGYLDSQGFLYFSERRKHVIRRRGENISSTELERIISTHPEIEACAAVGVPSPLGEDDVKLIVQLRAGSGLTTQQLYTFCQRNMAAFMLPQYIEVLTELPRTPVGKTDKDVLRRLSGKEWVAERTAAFRSKGS